MLFAAITAWLIPTSICDVNKWNCSDIETKTQLIYIQMFIMYILLQVTDKLSDASFINTDHNGFLQEW